MIESEYWYAVLGARSADEVVSEFFQGEPWDSDVAGWVDECEAQAVQAGADLSGRYGGKHAQGGAYPAPLPGLPIAVGAREGNEGRPDLDRAGPRRARAEDTRSWDAVSGRCGRCGRSYRVHVRVVDGDPQPPARPVRPEDTVSTEPGEPDRVVPLRRGR